MIRKLFLLFVLSLSFVLANEYCYSREWLNLLYYEKTLTGYHSAAHRSDFFVSERGRTDPKTEYEASLRLAEAQDAQFRTKFPLRYKRLAKQNNLEYLPLVQVSENIENVVLAYPNRYMQNPVSMFGHLFLILETENGLLDSKILHYVADTGRDAQDLLYAFKGLTGKYKGAFYEETYYKKIKEYSYLEDREVFYYELALSPEQIEDLQLHYLELQNVIFYYYFLDANCAFYIGKFLNVILPQDIIARKFYILPAEIINNLYAENLLTEENFRPAITKKFNSLYNSLDKKQKRQLAQLLTQEVNSDEIDTETLRAFLTISEFMISNHSGYAEIVRQNRIFAYQKLQKENIRTKVEIAEQVQKIKYHSLQVEGNIDKSASFVYTPIRFAENNILEIKNVSLLSFGIQKTNNLQYEFGLLDIDNITQANPILPSISWSACSRFIYGDNFLTNQELYLGQAYNLFNKGLFYVLAGANYVNYDELAERELNKLDLFSGIKIGWKQNLTANLDLALLYEHKYKMDYRKLELTYNKWAVLGKISCVNSELETDYRLGLAYLF